MKKEKAVIIKVNDNTFADENDHIISVDIRYEDGSVQGTYGFKGNLYKNFIDNMKAIFGVNDISDILGKKVLACTDSAENLVWLGNELGTRWVGVKPVLTADNKRILECVEGDILDYIQQKEKQESELEI